MRLKSHIARFAVCAFLLNALLPFFAVYGHTHQAGVQAALFGEKVLICTGEGFKWVHWQDLQKQPAHNTPDHIKCPLCYIAAHGLSVIAPDAVTFVILAQKAIAYYFYYLASAPLFILASLGSRAPPAPFFS